MLVPDVNVLFALSLRIRRGEGMGTLVCEVPWVHRILIPSNHLAMMPYGISAKQRSLWASYLLEKVRLVLL